MNVALLNQPDLISLMSTLSQELNVIHYLNAIFSQYRPAGLMNFIRGEQLTDFTP